MSLQNIQPTLPVRLLALDLDDTLLNAEHQISQGNRRALLAAEQRGVQVVLASGRATESMQVFAQELGMDKRPGYFIAYNGSSIVESDTGQEEWGVKVEVSILERAWDLAAALGQPIQTYVPGAILVSHDNEFTRLDSRLTGIPGREVNRDEFVAAPRVKLLMPGEPRSLDRIEAAFKEEFAGQANMFRSKPYFFEFMRPEADKGLALERLATMHGIPREAVMACGDSWNDEGMLRWAGVSVGMNNAAPSLKEFVTWVTTRDHHDDGVAEAIEKFILNA